MIDHVSVLRMRIYENDTEGLNALALLAGHAAEVERLRQDVAQYRASLRQFESSSALALREARADAETLRQALRTLRDMGTKPPPSGSLAKTWYRLDDDYLAIIEAALAAAQEPPAKGDDR